MQIALAIVTAAITFYFLGVAIWDGSPRDLIIGLLFFISAVYQFHLLEPSKLQVCEEHCNATYNCEEHPTPSTCYETENACIDWCYFRYIATQ